MRKTGKGKKTEVKIWNRPPLRESLLAVVLFGRLIEVVKAGTGVAWKVPACTERLKSGDG